MHAYAAAVPTVWKMAPPSGSSSMALMSGTPCSAAFLRHPSVAKAPMMAGALGMLAATFFSTRAYSSSSSVPARRLRPVGQHRGSLFRCLAAAKACRGTTGHCKPQTQQQQLTGTHMAACIPA